MARTSPWIVAALVAYGSAATGGDEPRNGWRIECKGGADRHGQIVLLHSEDGAEIARIPVAIPKGTPENNVARRVRKELRQFLPKDAYSVDIDGGEKIIVTARNSAKPFEIRLEQNTVLGTEVIVARE